MGISSPVPVAANVPNSRAILLLFSPERMRSTISPISGGFAIAQLGCYLTRTTHVLTTGSRSKKLRLPPWVLRIAPVRGDYVLEKDC